MHPDVQVYNFVGAASIFFCFVSLLDLLAPVYTNYYPISMNNRFILDFGVQQTSC